MNQPVLRFAPQALALLLVVATLPAEAEEIPWTIKVKQAFDESKSSGKPIFIDAWAVWCVPCKQMDETTYRDPKIVEAMTDFVPLKVDQDSSENFCERHDIEALPLVLYLDAEGREIGRRTGLQLTDDLLESMQGVRAGYDGYMDAMTQAKDDPEAAAVAASYLTESGNPRGSINLLRRAIKSADSSELGDVLALRLAQAQLASGDPKAATTSFTRLADNATDPQILGRSLEGLLQAQRERGRDDEAELTLARLQEEFPELAARVETDE